jgi:uncharacterized damage-inducible protein DinB
MHTQELLITPVAFLAPRAIIEGLTSQQAEQRVPGAPHSIAQILAHMIFWQEWFCQRCAGVAAPLVAHAADGWPPVAAGGWPELRQRFLAGLERAASWEHGDERISPSIDFPPLAAYTIGDAQVHIASHNAHHFGQIVLLRQMLGLWPPPAGSWTW